MMAEKTFIPQDTKDSKSLDRKEEQPTYIEKIPDDSSSDSEYDDSIEATKASNAIWLITFIVAMGGFLFGYDTGVISAVLVNLKDDLGHELSNSEKELVTSLTSGGALIGALMAGLPADRYGRKLGIYIGCVLFFIGSVIQAASFTVAQMSVGRFVVGLGVGSAAMIIPLYISELAPAKHRGFMIGFDNMSVTFGQLASYALGAGLTEVSHGWRYMVAIGGIPPIVLALLLPTCPESPRQLIAHDRLEEANKVIARIFPEGTSEQVASKVQHIKYIIERETDVTGKGLWWQYKVLHRVGSNFRALVCACAIMAISQLSGFNSLMYFSATLFSLVGFRNATQVSIAVGATNFVFTFVNMVILDRVGRRRILLITVLGMSLSLVVAAVAFRYIPISRDLSIVPGANVNWAGTLVLATIIVYIAFYAGGVATIGWVGTELLPMEVRALGTMLNTITCWGSNLVIASTFLTMMKGITPSGAFGFYAGICFLGWLFVVFFYPEVKGLPLEDVKQVFETGFGVQKAREMQRDIKAARQNVTSTA